MDKKYSLTKGYTAKLGQRETNHAPHIKNVEAGFNRYDPVHRSIFEVTFFPPEALGVDVNECIRLQEQVTNVGGLDALQKTTNAGTQKFYGVDVSYLNPTLETTYADIVIEFNLNLNRELDNYVLNIFHHWANLSYNKSTGLRGIKVDYISDAITIAEANRNGDVWRAYNFKHVMLKNITGLDTLDYNNNDAAKLTCEFRADYWEDSMDSGLPE